MDTLTLYRDDGPLARVVAALAVRLPVPPLAAAAGAVVVLLAGLVLDGSATSWWTAGGWAVHLILASAGLRRPLGKRLRWLEPAGLRAAEYLFIAWLAWRAGGAALPAVYVLLLAVAYHHYDVVYRVRYQQPPAAWVTATGLGWDGRTGVLLMASAAGVVAPVAGVVALLCATVFVGESAMSWRSPPNARA